VAGGRGPARRRRPWLGAGHARDPWLPRLTAEGAAAVRDRRRVEGPAAMVGGNGCPGLAGL